MPELEFKIGHQKYKLACAESDEKKLLQLAEKLDKRVKKTAKQFNTSNDKMIMMIAALMLEDELSVLQKKNDKSKKNTKNETTPTSEKENAHSDTIKILEPITTHIENLVKKLKNS